MYDDLGALADKLKMPNVSFQEMNRTENEIPHPSHPAPVNGAVEGMPGVAEKRITSPQNRTPARHLAESVPPSSTRHRDNPSLRRQQDQPTGADPYPVRLDRLFSVIGK
ncbi:hypothetical protein [Kosakonia cowanii]|uniref:hypothetical protein n=1 Tax=Kosakonia cowanii TaxID=208223 RepID=UPI00406408EE